MAKLTALPLAFLARMAALLDEDFPRFLAALNQPAESGLRVNTLKLTSERFQALSPWPMEPVPWCAQGFLLPHKTNAGLYPLHDAGVYYIQEPSTMAVAPLLAPQPGERVLDLCAAPGGKATHLAALMAGEGVLVANDIDSRRAAVLRRNLERWGARHAIVLSETPQRLAARWPAAFDRVLVDAPCSGEGMFRKSEQARLHWSEAHVAGCALRQQEILDAAAQLVRRGGWLGYATCTFSPEENEARVAAFLASHPDFELAQPAWFPGFSAGRPEWAAWPPSPGHEGHASTASLAAQEVADHTVRLWPHRVPGEGHFIAVLRRKGASPPQPWQPTRPAALRAADRAVLEAFWEDLSSAPLPEHLVLRPHARTTVEVYAASPDAPDLSGLRAPSPGWHLGTLHVGTPRSREASARFQPAQALALALRSSDVSRRLDEPMGSAHITRYLRGETLPIPGPDGWLLICVEGFPLGWGKRSGGVIKNHYPKALRWL